MGMKLGTAPESARKGKYTLEQALKKVYLIKSKNTIGVIHVPSILVGKRVRLVIEDDTEEIVVMEDKLISNNLTHYPRRYQYHCEKCCTL